MQVGGQPGLPCPVDERLGHTGQGCVGFECCITITQQTIHDLAIVVRADVQPTEARARPSKQQKYLPVIGINSTDELLLADLGISHYCHGDALCASAGPALLLAWLRVARQNDGGLKNQCRSSESALQNHVQ